MKEFKLGSTGIIIRVPMGNWGEVDCTVVDGGPPEPGEPRKLHMSMVMPRMHVIKKLKHDSPPTETELVAFAETLVQSMDNAMLDLASKVSEEVNDRSGIEN